MKKFEEPSLLYLAFHLENIMDDSSIEEEEDSTPENMTPPG